MRITIVCGHFIPAMGYIEVHLAKAFAELGHRVTVVTSTVIPSYVSHLHSKYGDPPENVTIKRLKPYFSLGQVVKAKGVRLAVIESKPDRILVIGLGKAFPKPALGLGIHTTVLLGDNSASYGDSPSAKTRLLFELFKRATYQRAIKEADRLVAYTPESFEAAGKMLGGKWADKLSKQNDFISLGFHPDEFFFDEGLRKEKRAELGYSEADQVLITATRLRAEKNLELVIKAFAKANSDVKWLILGSTDDDYSRSFQKSLIEELSSDRFLLLPHQPREALNAFYNAADMAVFTTPAISIIEAMGTGLPLIIPQSEVLSHLIVDGRQGYYYNHQIELRDLNPPTNRAELASFNFELFSWRGITKKLLD